MTSSAATIFEQVVVFEMYEKKKGLASKDWAGLLGVAKFVLEGNVDHLIPFANGDHSTSARPESGAAMLKSWQNRRTEFYTFANYVRQGSIVLGRNDRRVYDHDGYRQVPTGLVTRLESFETQPDVIKRINQAHTTGFYLSSFIRASFELLKNGGNDVAIQGIRVDLIKTTMITHIANPDAMRLCPEFEDILACMESEYGGESWRRPLSVVAPHLRVAHGFSRQFSGSTNGEPFIRAHRIEP